MAIEQTLAIIKPDAVKDKQIGKIIEIYENNGLEMIGCLRGHFTERGAREFYKEHKGKEFYKKLIEFTISGDVLLIALVGEDAIQKNRQLMGPADPKKGTEGQIRFMFGKGTPNNAVHGSDSKESFVIESNIVGNSLYFIPSNEP
jgi:nucleoside-diphosphate kinase